MDRQRQEAFQKLRPPCVELSSVGLKFKANQVAIKDVLRAIEDQHRILEELSHHNRLDAKLAEYAFFPLTHVFNESQRLSPRCLEVAVQSVSLLVSHGWQQNLAPEMGKQLLILMSLLAGGDPRKQITASSDELKTAAFECVAAVLKWLAIVPLASSVLEDHGTKNVVDQLTYLLAENLSETINDSVQLAAGHALSELFSRISDRVFLASLLPRTVSALVKALRPSTQARRTHKVLCGNLDLLRLILSKTLAGDVVAEAQTSGEAGAEVLDESWMKATSAQVRIALLHVVKLRSYDRVDVRKSLTALCAMVIEDCSKSLSDSVSIMLETLVILSGGDDDIGVNIAIKHLTTLRPELVDMLRSSLYDWTQALPRVMQANDDGPKELMLKRIANTFDLVGNNMEANDSLITNLTTTLLNSVANAIEQDRPRLGQIESEDTGGLSILEAPIEISPPVFQPVLFNHQSQKASTEQLTKWIKDLKHQPYFGKICRSFVDAIPNTEGSQKLSAVWLAVELLKKDDTSSFDLEDLILTDSASDRSTSRSYLIYDLYSFTKDLLIESSSYSNQDSDWRLTALALETLTIEAQQMGKDYRNELFETLYPVLALFSSKKDILRSNAMTTLNFLAAACQYDSARNMLIQNVDYLVNSIAWKLNTFNLSPEAPRVLNMVVRLVGARLIPHLDDLIASIFTALDNYHGYPTWVEMLFTVLKTMVDESAKSPTSAITEGQAQQAMHKSLRYQPISVTHIIDNLRTRKKRKLVHDRDDIADDNQSRPAPRRPWTREKDDPSPKSTSMEQEEISLESLLKQDEEGDLPAPTTSADTKEDDPMKPASKTHELLLKIAQSTVPHLSSPSPRVRHLLLQLLNQIAPLLSRHENTFLPLINAIWPAIIPRLFADHKGFSTSSTDIGPPSQDQSDEYTELPFNIVASAELVSTLCENAGDFMSSRMEQIFRQLMELFTQTTKNVESRRRISKPAVTNPRPNMSIQPQLNTTGTYQQHSNHTNISTQIQPLKLVDNSSPTTLRGAVDLRIIKDPIPANPPQSQPTTLDVHHTFNRTTQSQILTSLINLLITILTSTSLKADLADEIVSSLEPFVTKMPSDRVIKAIELFNPDLIWLMRERDRIESEIELGVRAPWDRIWRSDDADQGHGLGQVQVVF